jgi:uncharacterized RDD family membrane protein YckC/Tfp pilus assembly protein PilE
MYAGFWKRFFALIIDGIIIGLSCVLMIVCISFLLVKGGSSSEVAGAMGALLAFFFQFAAPLLYNALFESSSAMATPGKMALGIIVTDMRGNRITFLRALGRNAGKWVSNIILSIGYFMAAFTRRKQALHDIFADCLVVTKGADVPNLQPLPKTPAWKIVLILFPFCLLPVILIIGILAAIALPQYFKAVEKSRSVEAMTILGSVAASQGRTFASNNEYAADFEALDVEFPFKRIDARTGDTERFTYKLGSRAVVAESKAEAGGNKYTLTRCYASDTVCCSGNACAFLGFTPQKSPRDCCR